MALNAKLCTIRIRICQGPAGTHFSLLLFILLITVYAYIYIYRIWFTLFIPLWKIFFGEFWQCELLMDIRSIDNLQCAVYNGARPLQVLTKPFEAVCAFKMQCIRRLIPFNWLAWWVCERESEWDEKKAEAEKKTGPTHFCMKYNVPPNFNSFFFLTLGNETSNLYMCHTNNVCALKNSVERINFKNFVTFLCMFENYYNLFEFWNWFGEYIFPFQFSFFRTPSPPVTLCRPSLFLLLSVSSRSLCHRFRSRSQWHSFLPSLTVYSLQYPVCNGRTVIMAERSSRNESSKRAAIALLLEISNDTFDLFK